ncbi:MAG: acyl carrier protein [Deltaproteobacteria bacterium]|nr:acyl carrier protein [Deltaproteobacteria bacterium]MBW2306503.1 acyl carrier protein [Deltaproteobacteria bacterium]
MPEVIRKAIFDTVLGILNRLADDWEYSGEITPSTLLVADLGLESIDVVVLGTTIQKHYNQLLPFAEFFAEIGQREVRDIRIDEFVEFIYQHLDRGQ